MHLTGNGCNAQALGARRRMCESVDSLMVPRRRSVREIQGRQSTATLGRGTLWSLFPRPPAAGLGKQSRRVKPHLFPWELVENRCLGEQNGGEPDLPELSVKSLF